jgi:alpha-D-ribose 1-methylphosphonate 5-triphosphate synthase subunit PhnH
MNAQELQNIVPGFDNEAFGSQAVFRAALEALSHPGCPLNMPLQTALPLRGHGAAAALLLGLLDSDTSLWLSPALAQSDAVTWLKFHTGCQVLTDPGSAQFLWVAQGDALPALDSLRKGSEAYPDQSATCVIEVQDFSPVAGAWVLQGPGICGQSELFVQGIWADFESQWAKNQDLFPRGVDVFLTTSTQVVGLPRTTRILNGEEV